MEFICRFAFEYSKRFYVFYYKLFMTATTNDCLQTIQARDKVLKLNKSERFFNTLPVGYKPTEKKYI